MMFNIDGAGRYLGNYTSSADAPRVRDMAAAMSFTAALATQFDGDGIEVFPLNTHDGSVSADGVTTASAVSDVLSHWKFTGGVPFGTMSSAHLVVAYSAAAAARALAKPWSVVFFTDGGVHDHPRDRLDMGEVEAALTAAADAAVRFSG